MKDFLKEIGVVFGVLAAAVLAAGAIAALFWADYCAYRQRFPHADVWTYFFQ